MAEWQYSQVRVAMSGTHSVVPICAGWVGGGGKGGGGGGGNVV